MLVIGGTAILRPAVVALRAAGREVVVLSRSRERLAGMPEGTAGVVGDLGDPVGLAPVLAVSGQRLAAGLAYLPTASGPDGAAVLGALRSVVDGPLVVLLTSAAAAGKPNQPVDLAGLLADLHRSLTAAGVPAGDLRLLLLGWRPAGAGEPPRWHTPAEISVAALAGLADPAPQVLGVLRPWTDRPG